MFGVCLLIKINKDFFLWCNNEKTYYINFFLSNKNIEI
jgi:hypothetical protein